MIFLDRPMIGLAKEKWVLNGRAAQAAPHS